MIYVQRSILIKHRLQIALETAEAAVARTIAHAADARGHWAEAALKVSAVRSRCRRFRDAIFELDRLESTDNVETARHHCRELRSTFLELYRSAKIPFRCDEPSCSVLCSPRTTCWIMHLENFVAANCLLAAVPESVQDASTPVRHRAVPQVDQDASARGAGLATARATPSLLRQTVDILALESAYLQYYFIDVQLQIVSLPSIFPWLHQ